MLKKTLLPLLTLALGAVASFVPQRAHATCQRDDCRVELVNDACETKNKFAPEAERTLSSSANVTFLAYCMRYCYPPDGSPGTESLSYQPPANVLTVKGTDGKDIATTITQTERTCNNLPVFSATPLSAGSHRIWFPGEEEGTGGGLPILVSDTVKPAQTTAETSGESKSMGKDNTPATGEAPVAGVDEEKRGRCGAVAPANPAEPTILLVMVVLGGIATTRRRERR